MFNQKPLYRIENSVRVYNEKISSYDMFFSEIALHLSNHIGLNYKIYYLNCKSKHDFSLNDCELKYLYTEDTRRNESLYYYFSENIKKIKYFQRSDLFFLTSLKNLDLLILIPKLDENNKYYFNLILGIKSEFDINQFYNINFQSIILNSVIELNNFNLCENYMSKIFNIKNNKFKDNRTNNEEFELWCNEFINNGYENLKLTVKGRRIYKKIVFKRICFHLYWIGSKYQLSNSSFQIDYGYKEKILIPEQNGGFKIIESYHHYCLEDLIEYNPEYFCFSCWEIYENT